MPITLTIDRERRVVYSALHGLFTEAEFMQHAEKIKSHPAFDPSFSEILDCRGITEMIVSEALLQELAVSPSIYNPESKHVVIAPKGLIEKMATKYRGLATETRPNFAVVRTSEEAYEYLGKS
jgi:hypothetical protein